MSTAVDAVICASAFVFCMDVNLGRRPSSAQKQSAAPRQALVAQVFGLVSPVTV